MHTKMQRLMYGLLCAGLVIAGLWLVFRFLLPWLAPFLLAMAIAAIAEPAVRFMVKRRVPRAGAAGLATVILLAAIIAALVLGIGRGISELGALTARMPEIINAVSGKLTLWQRGISSYIENAPGDFGQYLQAGMDTLLEELTRLPGWLSGWLLGLATGFASRLPDIVLFMVTGGIGAYFCSASYTQLLRFAKAQVPERFQERAKLVYMDLRRSLGKWAKAQLLMTVITFFVLLFAFLMLRIRYSLVLAVVVAIIDMLPVFGTGTVLLPWALFELLTENHPLAVGLFITYCAATFIHNTVHAKLLGDQLGLHPLITLVSIYVGWRAIGVWGMIIFPILAVMVKQLNDHKLIKLWKTDGIRQ